MAFDKDAIMERYLSLFDFLENFEVPEKTGAGCGALPSGLRQRTGRGAGGERPLRLGRRPACP
jgi:hypothetical protein